MTESTMSPSYGRYTFPFVVHVVDVDVDVDVDPCQRLEPKSHNPQKDSSTETADYSPSRLINFVMHFTGLLRGRQSQFTQIGVNIGVVGNAISFSNSQSIES
jgi:hypothetical protein